MVRWVERSGAVDRWNDFTQTLNASTGGQTANVHDYQPMFKITKTSLKSWPIELKDCLNLLWPAALWLISKKRFGWVFRCLSPLLYLLPPIWPGYKKTKRLQRLQTQSRNNVFQAPQGNVRSNNLPVKRLSPMEMKVRRDKGLCYNCSEKYSPGHRCRTQKLYLLDGTQVEEETSDQAAEQLEEKIENPQGLQTEDPPEISLHAISGILPPQTMRLKGAINRHSVAILIDSGCAHNFIHLMTARKTGIKIQKEGTMEVMVANGEKLISPGCCNRVKLSM